VSEGIFPTAARGRPSTAELLALAIGIGLFAYLGWDGALWDARLQLMLHLVAVAAIAGLAGIALRGGLLPRTALELPILGLLMALALATASAQNPGLALRAFAATAAFAAMLPVALVVLRHRPTWVAWSVTLPVLGLAAISLGALGGRRLAWYLAGGPGLLPPIRMPAEGTPFGSVAVAPFILLAVLPLTMLIERRSARRAVQLVTVGLGVPLAILSGSRSAWIAIAVAALAFAGPGAWRMRHLVAPGAGRRWSVRRVLLAGAGIVALGAAAVIIAPRLTAVSSLIYRGFLWRDTLAAWAVDPLLGIGPGTMPFARQAAAPELTFPVRQPHSHDVLLGVLGDAGLVGLVAAVIVLVIVAAKAGPWAARTTRGRAAGAVLVGMGAGALFEDLTFLPNFNLLVALVAAMALADAGSVAWRRVAWPAPPLGAAAAAALAVVIAVLGLSTVTADAAAIAYRNGTDAAGAGRWDEAERWLARAVAIDPWHPSGPKSLAIAAEAAGHPDLARAAAMRAVALNPGDGPSWTNLALLCLDAGDRDCAAEAAGRAVGRARSSGLELINAALVYEALGRTDDADHAYRLSLATLRGTSLAVEWPRPVEPGADGLEVDDQSRELRLLLALRSESAEIEPSTFQDPAVRALAAAMVGDRSLAQQALAEAIESDPHATLTWDVAVVLARYLGTSPVQPERVAIAWRGGPLPAPEASPRVRGLTFDIATFRAYPRDELVRSAERLQPPVPWPWVLEGLFAG